jgi:alginate O-acetyltransferase complex protein AlgI
MLFAQIIVFLRPLMGLSLDLLWQQLIYKPKTELLFNSGLFLFLFLGFLTFYWLLRAHSRWRIAWVIGFSLYFYYKCAGWFWVLHVVIVVIDFYIARWIEQSERLGVRRWWLFCSVLLNMGILVYFKYTNYFASLMAEAGGWAFSPWKIILPVGVSFFTFQSLSYTIDVYKRELKALDSMLDYAFFVTFFPQMVAGPIVRAADFLPQIHLPLRINRAAIGRGVYLFCTGMFKKVVIADYIGVNFVDRVFLEPEKYTGLENLFGVYGYALQIYCDFIGYSDMAIGIALLIGFTFPLNFNAPYQSLSVTEFWRRWHISLSIWLRDYLYIPLGGNRSGSWGTWIIGGLFFSISLWKSITIGLSTGQWLYAWAWVLMAVIFVVPAWLKGGATALSTNLNLFATMLLGGLWHGAGNQFLIWGVLHGTGLAAERWWKSLLPGGGGAVQKILGWLWTFHFVCLCWIFFRAGSSEQAWAVLRQITTAFNGHIFLEFVRGYAPVVGLMALGYVLHFFPQRLENRSEQWLTRLPLFGKAIVVLLFVMLIMQAKQSDVQPFKYFDF